MILNRQVTPGLSSYNPEGDLDLFRPPLLLTRPEDASIRFAAQFRARFGADWPVLISPLMRTLWLTPQVTTSDLTGAIFTSETAVRAFARLSPDRGLRAFCVGPRTAQTATALGFDVCSGPGDAPGLARLIAANCSGARLLYPHGTEVAQDMEQLLEPTGLEIVSLTVYDQSPLALTADALGLLATQSPILLPLFSLRSVRLFAGCAPPGHPALRIAALSLAVAQGAAVLNPQHLFTAERPDSEALLAALDQLAHLPTSG